MRYEIGVRKLVFVDDSPGPALWNGKDVSRYDLLRHACEEALAMGKQYR